MYHLCDKCINYETFHRRNYMKHIKNSLLMLFFAFSTTLLANEYIFENAKNHLESNARYIEVEYSSKLVNDFCPKQSVGCYTSADRGRIILNDNISTAHHDVVIFGLYSDYIQHTNTGLIDSSLTCDLKVNYLKDIKKNNLANLYSGQCNALYKNKILVMN